MAEALWLNREAIWDLVSDDSVEKAIGSLARAADDRETLDLLLATVDDAIERQSKALLRFAGRPLLGYGTSRWALLRLDLLARSGMNLGERIASTGEYLQVFDVASALADEKNRQIYE